MQSEMKSIIWFWNLWDEVLIRSSFHRIRKGGKTQSSLHVYEPLKITFLTQIDESLWYNQCPILTEFHVKYILYCHAGLVKIGFDMWMKEKSFIFNIKFTINLQFLEKQSILLRDKL